MPVQLGMPFDIVVPDWSMAAQLGEVELVRQPGMKKKAEAEGEFAS